MGKGSPVWQQLRQTGAELRAVAGRGQRYLLRRAVQRVHPQAHLVVAGVVAERVQQEDIDVCESVQRGLHSRAYNTGRLSVRREAGEHLFHRLLYADLTAGNEEPVGSRAGSLA